MKLIHGMMLMSYRSWLRSVWGWLVDVFSEDPMYSVRGVPTQTQNDPHRIIDLLEKTDEFLTTVFKVSSVRARPCLCDLLHTNLLLMHFPQLPDFAPSSGPRDGSPVLGKAVFVPGTDRTNVGTPPVTLRPEYIKGTAKLSPQGKMQVVP